MMHLTSFWPVLVVPNLPTPSLLHISQGLGVRVMTAVGCQVVVVAVAVAVVVVIH